MHYTHILISCPTRSILEIEMVSRYRAQLHFRSKKLILVIIICLSHLYPPLYGLNKGLYHNIAFLYWVISIMIVSPLPFLTFRFARTNVRVVKTFSILYI